MRSLAADTDAAATKWSRANRSASDLTSATRLPGWLIVIVPALAEFVVGGYRIAVPSLWRDEAATISGSQRPVGAIWALMRNQDAVHGAYYFLVHAAIAIGGTSETTLRLPSLIAMCLAAGLTAALGRRLARASDLPAPGAVGLVAGLLLTAVPLTTRYAQEARPYALTTLFAVLATYLLVRAVAGGGVGASRRPVRPRGSSAPCGSVGPDESGAPRGSDEPAGPVGPVGPDGLARPRLSWWVGYAVALVLTGLFNLFALLLVVAHGVSLLAARRVGAGTAGRESSAASSTPSVLGALAAPAPGEAADALPATSAAASAVAPSSSASPGATSPGALAPGLVSPGPVAPRATTPLAPAVMRRWLASIVATAIVLTPIAVFSASQSAQLNWVTRPDASTLATLVRDFSGATLLIPVAVLLGWLGCVAGRGIRRRGELTLAVVCVPWLVVPPVLLIAASFVHPVYFERYVTFCLPGFSLLAAAGMIWLVKVTARALDRRGLVGREARVLAVVPAAAVSMVMLAALIGPQIDIRKAGARADNLRAVAAVLARHERPGDAILYVPWDTAVVRMAYPAAFVRLRDVELGASPTASATLRGLPVSATVVAGRLRGVTRVWTVSWAQPLPLGTVSADDLVAARAVSKMRLIGHWRVASVLLSLYAAR